MASLVLGQATFVSSAAVATATGMYQPTGVAVDPASGKVFVADWSNSRVLRFASGASLQNGAAAEAVLGQSDFTSHDPATTASTMSYPAGLAIDAAGRLWVVDCNNDRLLRFDGAASKPNGAAADGVLGQSDFTSFSVATSASGMRRPFALALDSAGRLWISDSGNSRVLRFDSAAKKPNGAAADGVLGQSNFTSLAPVTTASGMNYPAGVAVEHADLWVADTNNNRVLRFGGVASKPNGAAADGVLGQNDFTSQIPATTASGMNLPLGIAVDTAGRLWVPDSSNNRVLRLINWPYPPSPGTPRPQSTTASH